MSNNSKFFKTTVPLTINVKKGGSIEKAIADYAATDKQPELPQVNLIDGGGGFDKILPLKEFILKQPDLLYVVSTFVSQGANKNRDGFLRPVLAKIFETAKHKFVDFEHDVEAERKDKNPERYKVIGHIYDSVLTAQETGSQIPFYDLVVGKDGKLFTEDSPWRNQSLDITVAWVLYQFEYPELAEMIINNYLDGDNGKFGVSMEVLFSDYKYRVGEFDPDEEFDFDANSVGKIEGRKGTALGMELEPYWKGRKLFNGQPVTRILGGNIFFSGMALTSNRANSRSMNLSVASIVEGIVKKDENSQVASIIKAVASKNKNFDLSKCEIINGEPDCNCVKNGIEAQLDILNNQIKELASMMKHDDDEENGDRIMINQIDSNLKQAQLLLQNLYENNLDNDLSREEVMEYIENIENILNKTSGLILK